MSSIQRFSSARSGGDRGATVQVLAEVQSCTALTNNTFQPGTTLHTVTENSQSGNTVALNDEIHVRGQQRRHVICAMPLVQRVQSEARDGAMGPAEYAIAPSAPAFLRACLNVIGNSFPFQPRPYHTQYVHIPKCCNSGHLRSANRQTL